ncbi:hypothetical protein [Maricaulis sp.]|jgi:hypothetical protein|uniref:hypothetical protein n=1 Tax=Maricaulis sp. TaxID=1486257 RepID=UPI0025C17E0D|nr:hypothetical protein [Maricaulis sp.]
MTWTIIASTIALVGAIRLGLRAGASYAVATRIDMMEIEQRGHLSNHYRHWLRPIGEGGGALLLALFAGFLIGDLS